MLSQFTNCAWLVIPHYIRWSGLDVAVLRARFLEKYQCVPKVRYTRTSLGARSLFCTTEYTAEWARWMRWSRVIAQGYQGVRFRCWWRHSRPDELVKIAAVKVWRRVWWFELINAPQCHSAGNGKVGDKDVVYPAANIGWSLLAGVVGLWVF